MNRADLRVIAFDMRATDVMLGQTQESGICEHQGKACLSSLRYVLRAVVDTVGFFFQNTANNQERAQKLDRRRIRTPEYDRHPHQKEMVA
jgi:hypothetical protein